MSYSCPMSANEVHLCNVEDGYAEVWKGKLQRGSVSREKFGSTRTGTRWEARNLRGRVVGYGDTRADAVALVVAAPRF